MLFNVKGNVAAVLLIALLVLLSIAVFTFDPFIAQEEDVDYELLFSDSRSVLERSYYEQYRVALRGGLLLDYGVWYANQGYEVSTDLAEDKIAGNLSELYSGEVVFERGESIINISTFDDKLNVSITEGGIQVNITDAYVEMVTGDEVRRISFDDEYLIPSQIKRLVNNFNTWLECDAGDLTSRFKSFYDSTSCQFYSCNCGFNKPSVSDFNRLKEEYGVVGGDLEGIVDESLGVLNNIIALNASSCNVGSAPESAGYACFVESFTSPRVDNFLKTRLTKGVPCIPTPDGDFEEVDIAFDDEKALNEWVDGRNSFSIWYLTEREALHSKFLGTQIPYDYDDFASLLQGISPLEPYLFEVSLDRAASGKVNVVCRSTDAYLPDFQEIRFSIKFSHIHDCPVPEVERGNEVIDCLIEEDEEEENGGSDECDCGECDCDECECDENGSGDDEGPDEGPDFSTEECLPEEAEEHCEVIENFHPSCEPTYMCEYEDDVVIDCEVKKPSPSVKCSGVDCRVCGDDLMCEAPEPDGNTCGQSGHCIRLVCESGQCTGERPRDSECRVSGQPSACAGSCNPSTGNCDYPSGNDCVSTTNDGCSYTGTCNGNGWCTGSPPTNVGDCCPGASGARGDGWCPTASPTCCFSGTLCHDGDTCPPIH